MPNPHGTCASCDWNTRTTSTEYDGSVWYRWTCWRCGGSPDVRLETTTDMQPPACDGHLKERMSRACL